MPSARKSQRRANRSLRRRSRTSTLIKRSHFAAKYRSASFLKAVSTRAIDVATEPPIRSKRSKRSRLSGRLSLKTHRFRAATSEAGAEIEQRRAEKQRRTKVGVYTARLKEIGAFDSDALNLVRKANLSAFYPSEEFTTNLNNLEKHTERAIQANDERRKRAEGKRLDDIGSKRAEDEGRKRAEDEHEIQKLRQELKEVEERAKLQLLKLKQNEAKARSGLNSMISTLQSQLRQAKSQSTQHDLENSLIDCEENLKVLTEKLNLVSQKELQQPKED